MDRRVPGLLMKIVDLQEARLAGGSVTGIIPDNTLEGDALWG